MVCSWPCTCARCQKLDGIRESACFTCACYGPDIDCIPICHKYVKTMLPCERCGEREGVSYDERAFRTIPGHLRGA